MNSEVGIEPVISRPNVITYLVYGLHTPSHKLRTHVAEMIGPLCILSQDAGYKRILSAFSDFRIFYEENFRFEYLVQSIAVRDEPAESGGDSEAQSEADEAALWEYRWKALSVINCVIGSSSELEERMSLRDELARRGLNEVITVSDLFRSAASPSADIHNRL